MSCFSLTRPVSALPVLVFCFFLWNTQDVLVLTKPMFLIMMNLFFFCTLNCHLYLLINKSQRLTPFLLYVWRLEEKSEISELFLKDLYERCLSDLVFRPTHLVTLYKVDLLLCLSNILNLRTFLINDFKLISWVWNSIERPGLESQRSRKRLFSTEISNSLKFLIKTSIYYLFFTKNFR